MTTQRATTPLLSLLLGSVLFFLSLSVTAQASSTPTITLIIDDIGYNLRNGLRAVNLPGAVNYAVLPHTPYSKRLAKAAHQQGKIVMLHAPMTNIHQREPGPGTLSPDMDQASFIKELNKSLAVIPFVQGINNHMGSQLTQDKTRMQWLMEEANKRKLFFIDSRTTAASVAETTARENGVPSMSRDVFLDHIRTPKAVNEAFELLIRMAKRKGHAIGIGHPHRITLDMLEARLPELKKQGIRLVSVPNQLLAMGQTYDTQPNIMPAQIPPPLDGPLQSASERNKAKIMHSSSSQVTLLNEAESPLAYKTETENTSSYKTTIYKAAIVRKKPAVDREADQSAIAALQRQHLVTKQADTDHPTEKDHRIDDNSTTDNGNSLLINTINSSAKQTDDKTVEEYKQIPQGQPLQSSLPTPSYRDVLLQKGQEPEWLKLILTQHWDTPTGRSTPSLNSTPN